MQFYWINATTYSTSSIFNVARCKKWKLYEWIIGHWNTFDFIYLQCSLLFTNKLSIFAKKKCYMSKHTNFFRLQILLRLMIMQMPSRKATSIFNGIVLNWVAPLFFKYILKFAQMQFHDINLYNNNFKMFGILQVLNLNADKRSEGQK